MYECPLCGKAENRRGDPFTDVSNVVGHIDGSHDDDHKGVRGGEMRAEIEATADVGGSDDGGTAGSAEGTETDVSDAQRGTELDLQPAESHHGGAEAGDAGGGAGSPGGRRMELPDDAGPGDDSGGVNPGAGSGGLRPADESAVGDADMKPECPECGERLLEGHAVIAQIHEHARRSKAAKKFLKANEGAQPDLACRDPYGCGYYAEGDEAYLFDSPSSGWGTKLAVGAGALAAVGLAGLAAQEQSGGGNDDILDGGDRVV